MKGSRILVWLSLIVILLLAPGTSLAQQPDPVSVIGKDYTIESGQIIESDVAVVGGDLVMQPSSQVFGEVAVTGGDAQIAGSIAGNLVVIGGDVKLLDQAYITGDVISLGDVTLSGDAAVDGRVISGFDALDMPEISNHIRPLPRSNWGEALVGFIGAMGRLVFGVMLLLLIVALGQLFPMRIDHVANTVRRAWLHSAGAGVLTMLVLVVLIPIFTLMIIGIPVVLVLVGILLAATLVGLAACSRFLGELVLGWIQARQQPVLQTGVGALIILLLGAIPCIGAILLTLVALVGVGAVVLTRAGSYAYPGSASGSES
ncbi:MAG: hypothetical protein GXY52_10555 [Chloroflexi bacterium]|nr:hypothetical protein [Chloroflexota bacterium]